MGGKAVACGGGARHVRVLVLGSASLVIPACASPFVRHPGEPSLRDIVEQAIDREVVSFPADVESRETSQPVGEVEQALAARRDELEALSPATERSSTPFTLGMDLTGGSVQDVLISLETAVRVAIANNLSIRIANLQTAINSEDLINAQAAFDFVLFSSANLARIDEPSTVPVLNDIPLGTPFSARETYRFETGVRRQFHPGTELTLSTDLTRVRDNAPGISFSPDPAYTAALRLGLTQPLLRGFGSDVNTATIRLAEHNESRAAQQLVADLLDLAEQVESAYWSLVFAWKNVEIQQWLVDEGVSVRDVLDRRREFDTRLAQYSDAVARVEQRKAGVIRARRAVHEASDALKRLLNDPNLTTGTEAVLQPADSLVEAPLTYHLRESLLAAVLNRPEIEIARLGIADADIRADVADNARLPLLNLSGEIAYYGQQDNPGDAYDNSLDDDFIDYVLGLLFEYPLGNRAADAEYRSARLQRSQSVFRYQQAVQDVVREVKSSLRGVVTNYELIQATRSYRVAQAENLRALLVEEETMAGLTPEFLNLKFQRQEDLANARRQELLSIVDFDQAVASLHGAMGTGLRVHRIDVEMAGAGDAELDLPPADDAANP